MVGVLTMNTDKAPLKHSLEPVYKLGQILLGPFHEPRSRRPTSLRRYSMSRKGGGGDVPGQHASQHNATHQDSGLKTGPILAGSSCTPAVTRDELPGSPLLGGDRY